MWRDNFGVVDLGISMTSLPLRLAVWKQVNLNQIFLNEAHVQSHVKMKK